MGNFTFNENGMESLVFCIPNLFDVLNFGNMELTRCHQVSSVLLNNFHLSHVE